MEILKRDYKIDIERCEQEVKRNKFSDITTSYYLIQKRKERGGNLRQQYKDELRQMIAGKRKTKKPAAPQPITLEPLASELREEKAAAQRAGK